MKNRYGFDLFADNRHPNPYGSFLVALMFYKQFTGNDASQAPFLKDLSSATSANSGLDQKSLNELNHTYSGLDPDILNELVRIADRN